MNTQLRAGAVRPTAAATVTSRMGLTACYCVHVSADRRAHRMSVVDPEDLAGVSAGPLAAAWRVAGAGGLVGTVRQANWLVCRAIMLPCAPPPPTVFAALDHLRQLLRTDGDRADPSRLLREYPLRPLLATFARRADPVPALVDRAHRMLLVALLRLGPLLDVSGRPLSFCEYNARLRPGDSWDAYPMLPAGA